MLKLQQFKKKSKIMEDRIFITSKIIQFQIEHSTIGEILSISEVSSVCQSI